MTHYELQLARIAKYPTRHEVLIQTPRLLMFVVDGNTIYTHEYNDEGRCISATWDMVEN